MPDRRRRQLTLASGGNNPSGSNGSAPVRSSIATKLVAIQLRQQAGMQLRSPTALPHNGQSAKST
jgi:hypothetical protein